MDFYQLLEVLDPEVGSPNRAAARTASAAYRTSPLRSEFSSSVNRLAKVSASVNRSNTFMMLRADAHLLLPALVSALYEFDAGPLAKSWIQPRGTPEWMRRLDMRWMEASVLIAEDARSERLAEPTSAALQHSRGALSKPDYVTDLALRIWANMKRFEDTEVGLDRLIAFLVLVGRGQAPPSSETPFVFNANLAYWLSDIFNHTLLKAVVPALLHAVQDSGMSGSERTVTISSHSAQVCAEEVMSGQHR
jgi:hypothetical protein